MKALIFVHNQMAGTLEKTDDGKYKFIYQSDYSGPPVSLTMPVQQPVYEYDTFPPFFEGLLPEGQMLDALLRKYKIDRNDYLTQLIKVGKDVVGAVTIENMK